MKNSTYKWIIGCLLALIVILTTYLILKENNVICISFSDALSLSSTISSLILSVVDTFKKENISEEDKQSAIKTMEQSKNSMMMFLKKCRMTSKILQ